MMLCHFSCYFVVVVVHGALHSWILSLTCIDRTINHVIHIPPFPLLYDEEWKLVQLMQGETKIFWLFSLNYKEIDLPECPLPTLYHRLVVGSRRTNVATRDVPEFPKVELSAWNVSMICDTISDFSFRVVADLYISRKLVRINSFNR